MQWNHGGQFLPPENQNLAARDRLRHDGARQSRMSIPFYEKASAGMAAARTGPRFSSLINSNS
jgi:hypothetical protein